MIDDRKARISLGSDHAGFALKEEIKAHLLARGYAIVDAGTDSEEAVDYPDFVIPAAEAVAGHRADLGIVLGGSGNGEAIAANKVRGIRCALCWNAETARLAREHNDANLIALGARMTDRDTAIGIVDEWLESEYQGGRHRERLRKISDYEEWRGSR